MLSLQHIMRIKVIFFMLAALICGYASAQDAPKGNLIYCSYSQERVAGLGKSYCELIADPGTAPKVVVVLDQRSRIAEEVRAEYTVGRKVVEDLQDKLAEAKVYELNAYSADEHLEGGTIYRIYMEYDSGEKVNAWWHAHDVAPEAVAAFSLIKSYFEPWRKKAEN